MIAFKVFQNAFQILLISAFLPINNNFNKNFQNLLIWALMGEISEGIN